MTATPPLEIKVIYSASAHRKRRGRAARKLPVAAALQAGRRRAWVGLGIVNLLVACALCYGTWWRADPYLYVTMVMRTPVDGINLDDAGQLFGIPPKELEIATSAPAGTAELPSPEPAKAKQPAPYQGKKAQTVIVGSAYAWLALSTIACCMIALSGGAALGRAGGSFVRIFGVIAAFGGLAAMGYMGYRVWGEYGRQFQPTHLRAGYSFLVPLTAFVGMILARGARRIARWAAALLILSAAGSAAGLYFGAQAGAIPTEWATPTFLGIVFVVHSLYGWILLPLSSRIGR